ncbi:hypothetical protein EI94DRAFT_1725698 [Lactarius quietus]|nr:hypothetical protein EI94DRAFT_1725698 [Lactarius quietus]
MTLRLSSPSFLDSVVHDGSSENPLYVIDTDDNVTKVRRSDPKGFVNVSRVRWPTDFQKSSFRKNKGLTGVEVVFGKGHWKPADEFLGYGSLSSHRKFYIPHHRHSLRWKRTGSHYACTTETVKGPVAILEPAMQRAPPQLKILDPLFRLGCSKPQRMHNGLPLSLLDFLLVTAMLLVTPNDEWMNVTRSSPSHSFPDDGNPSDASRGSLLSSNPLPSTSSLSSGVLDPIALDASEATPEIERWRSTISSRAMDDNRSRYAESVDGPVSETASRATSRLSSNTDNHSAMKHAYTAGHSVYGIHSSSSLSLSSPQHANRRTRELPPVPPSQGSYSYTRGPSSVSSHTSYLPHRRASQDDPPPLPSIPASSYTPSQDQRPPISPISAPSRRTTSPTSSIHTRSLPVPPPLSTKPPVPPLPIMPSHSSPVSPDAGPAFSTPPHPTPQRSQSYTHLRSISAFPESQRDYDSPIKLPPNYSSNTHDPFDVTPPAHGPVERAGMGRSLSIRTTNISPETVVLRARSASRVAPSRSGLPTGDGDPLDLPPAYSVLDLARSPLQLLGDDE